MAGSRGLEIAMVGALLSYLVLMTSAQNSTSFNITEVLLPYPDYSLLNDWLNRTGVATEINNQTSVTILAPNNNVLQGYLSGIPNAWNDPLKIADTLRYHVLLEFFSLTELRGNTLRNGTLVTTLLQTTGRANQSQGFITIYNNGSNFLAGHRSVDSYGNETILGNVTQRPFQYSVLQVSALLSPAPPELPSPTPAPSPLVPKSPSPAPVSPAPTTITTTAPGPEGSSSSPGNYGTMTRASKPLLVLTILCACLVTAL